MELGYKLFLLFVISTTIEIVVAIAIRYKEKKELLAVLLVNLVTQPTLNYCLYLNHRFRLMKIDLPEICVLEIVVTLLEWKMLVYALEKKSSEMFVLSLTMNLTSFLAGFIFATFLR